MWLKEHKKNIPKEKNQTFYLFLYGIKVEQKGSIFGKQCINKSAFYKHNI